MIGITMKTSVLYRLHVTELKRFRTFECSAYGGQCERCSISKELCINIEVLEETIAKEPPIDKKDFPQIYKIETDMDMIALHIYTLYLLKGVVCTQISKGNCLRCFLKSKDKCCKVLTVFHQRFDGCVINGELFS
jgi:hypothetical protein